MRARHGFTALGDDATTRLHGVVDRPDRFPDIARPFRATGRKQIWTVDLDGQTVFLKIYRPRAGVAGLKEILRLSAGPQTWRITNRALEAGIRTPLPLAAGERRDRFRRLNWSFFACEKVEHPSLASVLETARTWNPEKRLAFAARLGCEFGALTRRRFFQPDLKPTNFLVSGDPATDFELFAIDLRLCRVGPISRRAEEKTRRQLRERILEGWTADEFEALLRAYRRSSFPPPVGSGELTSPSAPGGFSGP